MIDLDAIKARLSNITPGDWYQGVYPDGDPIDGPTGEYRPNSNILCEGEEIARAECTTDAAFIAHAPTDIAALIAEVEALRSEALTMRQWAEEAAAAENANAQELREARAEVARLRALLGLE